MAVATIQLAFNSRKLNKQTQEWEDADVFFVRAAAFKQLAENAAETLTKGMEVHVSGRLKTEQWQDKTSGDKRSAAALLLDSIGPNLAYATAKVEKVGRGGQGAGSPVHDRPSGAGGGDPWGDVPPPDSEMPF